MLIKKNFKNSYRQCPFKQECSRSSVFHWSVRLQEWNALSQVILFSKSHYVGFWDYCIINFMHLTFIIIRWICTNNICLDTMFCQYWVVNVTKLNKSISYICLCNRKGTWEVNSVLSWFQMSVSFDSHSSNWFR